MEQVKVTVRFQGQSQACALRKGLGLQALQPLPKGLEFDCRKADCGICLIQVLSGSEALSAPTAAEQDFLRAMHADPHERLACQCLVFGDVTFEIDDPLPA